MASTGLERTGGEQVAGQRRNSQGKRAAEQELAEQPIERLVARLERCSDDDRSAAARGADGDDAPLAVEAGDRPGAEAALAGEDSAELATRDERWQAPGRGLEHVAVGRHELSHGRATGRVTVEDGAVTLDVTGRLVRLSAKALVDGRQECRCDPVVDQESGRGEHDGHPERKRQHQA